MPGNELAVIAYLLSMLNKITLPHLGKIIEIGAPNPSAQGYKIISEPSDVSTEDSRKKADIYLNGKGVSIKQSGGSFLFNRLQRAELQKVYSDLDYTDIDAKLQQIDKTISDFHSGVTEGRNLPWQDLFNETDFKTLLHFLTMQGSPNYGDSTHPAEFILEAINSPTKPSDIHLMTFDEYFDTYKNQLKIAMRRQWVGQDSDSEHGRALSLIKKEGNAPWIFNDVIGQPISGWRQDIAEKDRKTVYFLMIEKT